MIVAVQTLRSDILRILYYCKIKANVYSYITKPIPRVLSVHIVDILQSTNLVLDKAKIVLRIQDLESTIVCIDSTTETADTLREFVVVDDITYPYMMESLVERRNYKEYKEVRV